MPKKRYQAFLLICCALGAAPGFAQSAGQSDTTEAAQFEEARGLLQAGREQIVREEVRLTAAEAAAFWPAYEGYRQDIQSIRSRQADVVVEYLRAYRSGEVTEALAVSLIESHFDIRRSLLEAQRRHLEIFRKFLPARKLGRFYQLENKLDAELEAQLAIYVPLMDPV